MTRYSPPPERYLLYALKRKYPVLEIANGGGGGEGKTVFVCNRWVTRSPQVSGGRWKGRGDGEAREGRPDRGVPRARRAARGPLRVRGVQRLHEFSPVREHAGRAGPSGAGLQGDQPAAGARDQGARDRGRTAASGRHSQSRPRLVRPAALPPQRYAGRHADATPDPDLPARTDAGGPVHDRGGPGRLRGPSARGLRAEV